MVYSPPLHLLVCKHYLIVIIKQMERVQCCCYKLLMKNTFVTCCHKCIILGYVAASVSTIFVFLIFLPSNAFLRRRRKKALLRVNDRGGGWIMCILALCRVCVRVCARPHVTRTSAVTSLWQYSANDHNS